MATVVVLLISGLLLCVSSILVAPLWLNRKELPADENQHKCTKHRTDPQNDPRLVPRPDEAIKVIRLTNSGEFVDRCELTHALYDLNWDRNRPDCSFGAIVKPGAKALPKLAVMFVHGWKHDATPDDSDLRSFSELIASLRRRHLGEKHVVGIYVSWNASAGLPGFLENISFWVKKSNADRIAQSAAVTKIVSALGSVTRSDPSNRDQFIAIGHSFGARILFSATAQSLIYNTERAHPGFPGGRYALVDGPANAVILLNPAFEASRYTAMDDITRKEEAFHSDQPPLLVSISTDNDFATKRAFPIVQWLGLARSRRELTTLGNYQPYMTHRLSPVCDELTAPRSDHLSEGFVAAGLSLSRQAERVEGRVAQAHNPFIIAETTSAVINGHNGIWGARFITWLEELIGVLERHSAVSEPPSRQI